MKTFSMGRFLLALILAFFLMMIFVLPSGSGGGGCKECHKDVYNETINYPFPHSPVNNCIKCHIVMRSGRRGSGDTKRLLWKGYYRESLLLLEGLSGETKYNVEVVVMDRKGHKSFPSLLSIVPSEIKEVLEDDKNPPVIEEVVLEEVKPGIFVEAVLKLRTDKPTVFEIEYGLTPEYGERLRGDKSFVKDHKASLTGLYHKKTYHYRIISKDLFGNSAVSKDYTFDTLKPKEREQEGDRTSDIRPSIEELKPLKTEDGSVYLFIKNKTPSSASVRVAYGKTRIKKHGPSGLAPKRFAGIDACVKCHKQGASHPVGIPARGPYTRIPDTLPTGEGGVITCTTCHFPHGGMLRYFTRFEAKRDICVLCHTNF